MGRASRLKTNPDRDRYQHERDASERTKRSLAGGEYAVNPALSFEKMVQFAAMHEAGHIVAAVVLDIRVVFAILHATDNGPQRKAGGYTEIALALGDSQEEAVAAATTPNVLRVRTMQALAGQIAESLVNENEDDLEHGSEGDVKRALQFAMIALGPSSTSAEWTAYLNERWAEMSTTLTPMLPSVFRVANYLIEHANEEVPGDVLKALTESNTEKGGA